eukprot:TRINITY_DN2147_c0_g1_i3.p1 TRINITY_DN2147_c0_g1~~TRINITY_DN2147_c0_g1_i3.p1  ORF type:complete len:273 (+),score=48.79 TRINITY_DN2147_c0_g1_i3:306-1124(+)
MEVPTITDIQQYIHNNLNSTWDILNIYLFGSRLHQCDSIDSDYDYNVIVQGDYFFGCVPCIGEWINVNCYHVDHWRDFLRDNVIWAVMMCWLPSSFVVLETVSFDVGLRYPALQKAVITDASHNFVKAKRLWHQEGDYDKSKKNVVHGLRWLYFGLQVLRDGLVTDYTEGNAEWFEIKDCVESDWDYYEKKYRPIYKDLLHKVKHIVIKKPFERVHDFQFLDYIDNYGIESLMRDFSIDIRKHRDFPSLLHLRFDPLNSPMDEVISLMNVME